MTKDVKAKFEAAVKEAAQRFNNDNPTNEIDSDTIEMDYLELPGEVQSQVGQTMFDKAVVAELKKLRA